MPLSRLVCHCDACRGKADWPVEQTLEHAASRRDNKYTYELLASMVSLVQDRGARISTTTLTTKCLRSEVLQRMLPYTGDPDLMYASFRGTLWHGQLEQHVHSDSIEEPRFHIIDCLGLGPFSGSPDLLDVGAGTLYDYKFNKENPRWTTPWEGHVQQQQINRWLVDHADYVEWRGKLYALTPEGADHLAHLDDEVTDTAANRARFQPIDWQGLYVVYMDDRGPKPLLITRSEQVPNTSKPGTRAKRVADIWEDARVEEFIKEKYQAAAEAFAGVLPDIPEGFENWQHPLCAYCPVKGDCVDQYIEAEARARLRTAQPPPERRKARLPAGD